MSIENMCYLGWISQCSRRPNMTQQLCCNIVERRVIVAVSIGHYVRFGNLFGFWQALFQPHEAFLVLFGIGKSPCVSEMATQMRNCYYVKLRLVLWTIER